MKKEPVLIIMAAGMGSRYGGLKQIDPVGSDGEIIMDFSLYDAFMAGFKKAVFVIKREMEKDFRRLIDERAGRFMEVEYVFQELTDLPEGFILPEGRVKPWGTAHAVMACRNVVDGPFVVINADDYYGSTAFSLVYDFLTENEDDDKYRFCMAGYLLENTLTENGSVARGICETDQNDYLTKVTERTKIMWRGEDIAFTEDDGATWTKLEKGTYVSMNVWGFSANMMKEMSARFPKELERIMKENPMKGEYFMPFVVSELLKEEKATVKVLPSREKWYGVTYKEDRETVVQALQSMKDKGLYPEKLWK